MGVVVIRLLPSGVRSMRKFGFLLVAIGQLWSLSLQATGRDEPAETTARDTTTVSAAAGSHKVPAKVFELSGFIKYDAFADTRQVVNAREGLVSLYPEHRLPDVNGHDVNAGLNWNMLAIHSRLGLRVHGPVVLNADQRTNRG